MRRSVLALAFFVLASAAAGVVDRVAVVVGNHVITESEVLLEVRLTEFFNGQPLDLGADQRKAAAERLVDQQLIRNEMEIGGYPAPAESEGDAVMSKFRQENYRGMPAFRAELTKYSLAEDEVKRHLLWQAAAMRFTDLRFNMAIADPAQQSADRSKDPDRAKDRVEDQMAVWLKEARSSTRIQFKKGAFQ